jgi:hypothetical protein
VDGWMRVGKDTGKNFHRAATFRVGCQQTGWSRDKESAAM